MDEFNRDKFDRDEFNRNEINGDEFSINEGKPNENTPKNKTKSNILGIVFLLWFTGSLGVIIYFAKNNTSMIVLIFGQYFLVFGLIALFNKSLMGIILVIAGLACIVITSFYKWGDKLGVNINVERLIPIIISGVLIIAGILLMVVPIFKEKRLKQRCTIVVPAKVKELLIRHSVGSDNTVYAPVYEFYYNGENRTYTSNIFSNIGVPKIGDDKDIFINYENPEEVYVPTTRGIKLFFIVMGTAFVISGAIGLIYFL